MASRGGWLCLRTLRRNLTSLSILLPAPLGPDRFEQKALARQRRQGTEGERNRQDRVHAVQPVQDGREYTLGLGNKIVPLSPEENGRWTKAVRPIIDDYIKEVSAKGLPAEKAVKEVENLIRQYGKAYK